MAEPFDNDLDLHDSIEPSLAHRVVRRAAGVHFGAPTQVLPDYLDERASLHRAVHFASAANVDGEDAAESTASVGVAVSASAGADAPECSTAQAAEGLVACRPAATATSTYAAACELVAIALLDIAEYDQAVGSLTQVLPVVTAAYTQDGRDGWTQAIPQAAGSGSPLDAAGDKPRRRVNRAAVAAVVVVLALVAAVGAFFVLDGPGYIASMAAEVDEAAVSSVLEANTTLMAGFASNDYVAQTPYALSDVRIESADRQEDGSVTVDATAVLSNESFVSDCVLQLSFVHSSQLDRFPSIQGVEHAESPDGEWTGTLLSSTATTRAIAGVTVDPDFGDGFAPTFDEASQTCTFTASSGMELWFGAWSYATPYTYTFDGTAWTRAAGDATSTFAYNADAIAGSYAAGASDSARLTSFKIVNFDTESGTFTLEYKATSTGFNPQAISGVISCAMSVSEGSEGSGDFSQADGYVYTFAGDGSSSAGDGAAHIEGVFGLDGELFFDFSGDYTKPAFLFGNPTNETMSISGTVSKAG